MKQLFVGNISWESDEDELRNVFETKGIPIESVKIMKDHETGRSRGFGFIHVDDRSDLDMIVDKMNGTPLRGRPIGVEPAKGAQRRVATTRY